jgi:hypothetical protein
MYLLHPCTDPDLKEASKKMVPGRALKPEA